MHTVYDRLGWRVGWICHKLYLRALDEGAWQAFPTSKGPALRITKHLGPVEGFTLAMEPGYYILCQEN